MLLNDLDTPALILDLDKLEQNILDMGDFANEHNLKLRPHVKAHKLPQIAIKQIAAGAKGITVAKLGEAEVMAEAGITDILIAYPVVGQTKIKRLIDLAKRVKVCTVVDHLSQARALSQAFAEQGLILPFLVEVDSGLKRCGFVPGEELMDFVIEVVKLPGLKFKGLLTHAGHAYGVSNMKEVERIGRQEGETLIQVAEMLKKQGIEVDEVSVGSTPTAKIAGQVAGVTEIRPGNYVFYDAIQIGLGLVEPNRCALTVLSTVVSAPASNRSIIDAGSKTLALDRGAHGNSLVAGFGYLPDWENWQITRLSEEHGILESESNASGPNIGAKVQVIPNHACPVINLANEVYVVQSGQVIDKWEIAARGKVF